MFEVNNKGTSTTPLVSLLLTVNIFHTLLYVSNVTFEHVIPGWVSEV